MGKRNVWMYEVGLKMIYHDSGAVMEYQVVTIRTNPAGEDVTRRVFRFL